RYAEQFQHDQPDPAGGEKPRELPRSLARAVQAGGQPGEEDEDGRAEVRDPPGEEESGRRARQVRGVEPERIRVEVVAHVVQGHEDDDRSPREVDGLDALALHGPWWVGRSP